MHILAYSLETVVAEKFQAMIDLAEGNSRMKDFFDVYRILEGNQLDNDLLQQAIIATFHNRKTKYDSEHSFFREDFEENPMLLSLWEGFLRKMKWEESLPFGIVISLIKERLQKYWENLR